MRRPVKRSQDSSCRQDRPDVPAYLERADESRTLARVAELSEELGRTRQADGHTKTHDGAGGDEHGQVHGGGLDDDTGRDDEGAQDDAESASPAVVEVWDEGHGGDGTDSEGGGDETECGARGMAKVLLPLVDGLKTIENTSIEA